MTEASAALVGTPAETAAAMTFPVETSAQITVPAAALRETAAKTRETTAVGAASGAAVSEAAAHFIIYCK